MIEELQDPIVMIAIQIVVYFCFALAMTRRPLRSVSIVAVRLAIGIPLALWVVFKFLPLGPYGLVLLISAPPSWFAAGLLLLEEKQGSRRLGLWTALGTALSLALNAVLLGKEFWTRGHWGLG